MNKSEILETLQNNRKTIKSHGVDKLYLTGSYAREKADDESDIDFIVEFKTGRGGFDDYTGLKHLLEDLFNTEIDLVKRDLIREELRDSMLGDSIDAAV